MQIKHKNDGFSRHVKYNRERQRLHQLLAEGRVER